MVGIIAFSNNSGLGAQTRRLVKMIKPDKVLVIDSSSFSENKEINLDWYKDYQTIVSHGFPSNEDIKKFLKGLKFVLTCENPFNFNLVYWGQQQGTKIYCQVNYEFCENLSKPYLPIPDKFLMPSYWKIDDMKLHFGDDRVQYLPPPIDPAEFEKTRQVNLSRKGKARFLHIIGTMAHKDRNGTADLLKALKFAKGDFELVIRTQHQLPMEYSVDDPRVTYDLDSKATNAELYEDFDALILPRRYGGLSLTTNEALMSGLPVIMPKISPNDKLLPEAWLVEAERTSYFPSRSLIAVYSSNLQGLGAKMDWLSNMNLDPLKATAFWAAKKNFSEEVLKPEYEKLFKSV
jgi:glycosyltransferase involved in cell wall biosynthesis